jgi:transcription-repair coupling factor (superfamily II helicase)
MKKYRILLFITVSVGLLFATTQAFASPANPHIIDRADTFGLAQLYQLRGRVGRGAARAYSYFFRHNKLSPTIEVQQRLEVIAKNT